MTLAPEAFRSSVRGSEGETQKYPAARSRLKQAQAGSSNACFPYLRLPYSLDYHDQLVVVVVG